MIRRYSRALVCSVILVSALPLLADSVVRCESKGGRRICKADEVIGSVVLKNRRSIAECEEGESWGYTRDAIWVDHGCRADFQVFTRRDDRDAYGRDRDRYDRDRFSRDRFDHDRYSDRDRSASRVVCESNGSREFCAADTRAGVLLSRTLGRADCIQGRSWGFTDRGVWVDRGCRAEFILGRPLEERRSSVLVCESSHDRRQFCAADTRFGVELKRQLSISDCVFGRTWGYDRNGVWVTSGCRGEFLIRR